MLSTTSLTIFASVTVFPFFGSLSLTVRLQISDSCRKQQEWNGIIQNQSCVKPKCFLLNINYSIISLQDQMKPSTSFRNKHGVTVSLPASRAGFRNSDSEKKGKKKKKTPKP